jgi:hypothetical protein
MGSEYNNNLRKSTARLALLSMSLQDFATQVLAHALRRDAIDHETIQAIRSRCIINLKNSHSEGVSINDEAEVFGEAVSDLEQFMDAIISDAWEMK